MKRVCENQCAQCPFRSTAMPGWLGDYGLPGTVFSALWHGNPFFCHTRVNYRRDDWQERAMREGPLCLGALIFVGRQIEDGVHPEPTDPEIAAAITRAMARYHADPSQFDVMEPRAFKAHHEDPAFRFQEVLAGERGAGT